MRAIVLLFILGSVGGCRETREARVERQSSSAEQHVTRPEYPVQVPAGEIRGRRGRSGHAAAAERQSNALDARCRATLPREADPRRPNGGCPRPEPNRMAGAR